jgi:Uma2 family endonuclease
MAITEKMIRNADDLGIRLEIVGGIPVWEALPVYRHQTKIFRIQVSIRPVGEEDDGCGCFHASDVSIRFPDGSQKRPDIAIFCREPEEQDAEITLVPEAVIEIISKGYEAKDTVIGVPFYLSQGIRDIVLYDPETNITTHITPNGRTEYTSPVELTFACGCRATI